MSNEDHVEPKPMDYEDWKLFLADRVEWCRGQDSSFSFRKLARDADLGHYSNIYKIISGTRQLEGYKAHVLGKALNLEGTELDQFNSLILGLKSDQQKYVPLETTNSEIFKYGSILSIAQGTSGFDPNQIIKNLNGLVSIGEVLEAFEYFRKIGLLENVNGKWAAKKIPEFVSTAAEYDEEEFGIAAHNFLGRIIRNSQMQSEVRVTSGRISKTVMKKIMAQIRVLINQEFKESHSDDSEVDKNTSYFFVSSGIFDQKQ